MSDPNIPGLIPFDAPAPLANPPKLTDKISYDPLIEKGVIGPQEIPPSASVPSATNAKQRVKSDAALCNGLSGCEAGYRDHSVALYSDIDTKVRVRRIGVQARQKF